MNNVVAAIDAHMEANFGNYAHTFFGFCELSNRTTGTQTQPIPVTITGTHKRSQVALDDKKQMVTWVRLGDTITYGTEIEDNDWGFGTDQGNVQTATLRMIVATKVELGENIIFDIGYTLPGFLSAADYEVVSVDRNSITIDTDHETIYLTELGAGQYEKHRFPWNLNAISIPVQFIYKPGCNAEGVCCENSIESETEDCLILE